MKHLSGPAEFEIMAGSSFKDIRLKDNLFTRNLTAL